MAFYRQVGEVPPKRHTQFRRPDGGLYSEELMGEEGFSSDSSLLYHRGIPSAMVDARPWDLPDQTLTPNAPLMPRHLKLHDLFPGEEHKAVDPVTGRRLVLGNADVRISYAVSSPDLALLPQRHRRRVRLRRARLGHRGDRLRRADGRPGRLRDPPPGHHAPMGADGPGRTEPLRTYAIEANSHIAPPKRYLSKYGQLLEHSPYSERDLRGPAEPLLGEGTDVEVYVKHRGDGPGGLAGSVHVVPEHPFDVVGWDGCLYPYVFNVADFEPITGRVHQPPPVHQVFEGQNFVVCNFVPRKVDYHPLAVPVPYYHSNVDSDEVMFYVDGDYEARKGSGIGKGSISLHPGGHSHGPQPGAVERSLGAEFFDELAVMVDTFRPLGLGEAGTATDDGKYAWSWSGRGPSA